MYSLQKRTCIAQKLWCHQSYQNKRINICSNFICFVCLPSESNWQDICIVQIHQTLKSNIYGEKKKRFLGGENTLKYRHVQLDFDYVCVYQRLSIVKYTIFRRKKRDEDDGWRGIICKDKNRTKNSFNSMKHISLCDVYHVW